MCSFFRSSAVIVSFKINQIVLMARILSVISGFLFILFPSYGNKRQMIIFKKDDRFISPLVGWIHRYTSDFSYTRPINIHKHTQSRSLNHFENKMEVNCGCTIPIWILGNKKTSDFALFYFVTQTCEYDHNFYINCICGLSFPIS